MPERSRQSSCGLKAKKGPVGATHRRSGHGKENPADVKKQSAQSRGTAAKAAPSRRRSAGCAGGSRRTRVPPRRKPARAGEIHVGASIGPKSTPADVGHGRREAPTAVAAAADNREGRQWGNRPLRVSPLARRIAADKGIDLAALHGSGPGGRIIQARRAKAPRSGPARQMLPVRVPAAAQRSDSELSKMRLAIARNLVSSKQSVPALLRIHRRRRRRTLPASRPA
jgi:pyruvate/2-oxoglutarate dehydrogenase complex dihydrolipoamide acyltransferase (E2) component